ncbi:hypothetical protein [Nocardioides sp. SYSU D00065]|uniref:hypothetical protein n=1 Tax=Nocardioides sp. SYSU D00065 TaxID=2817378 RepID=UPI001B3347F0|nr:hypothetical protein [Nocardioides sp. SYSU D00065]
MTHTPLEDQVRDALHRRVDPLHHPPLTVDDVRRRAGRIQRRRTAVAGAAVAAALAVVGSVGLAITGPAQRSDVPPATQSPVPAPAGPVLIDTRSAPVTDSLGVALLDVDTPSLIAGGEVTPLPERYDQLTPYLAGWLAVVNVEGARTVRVLDDRFEVLDERGPTSALSVSPDGSRIAWAERDGTRWAVVDADRDGAREERRTAVPAGPVGADVRVVGFLPDDGLVVARTDPATGEETTLVLGADGSTSPLPGFLRPEASSAATGQVAGQTSVSGDGSCWQVSDAATGDVAWRTCEHSLGAFSPDGRHVAAFASYLDGGNGSPTVSLLDAATGEPVVDFEMAGARRSIVMIDPEVAWEDEETVVATMVSNNQQYVVRLGLDGTVERLSAPATTVEPGAVALKLAAS